MFGGTKYRDELARTRYLAFFLELGKARKTVVGPTQDVDQIQKRVEQQVADGDFDDAHLVAIVLATGCRLICTNDRRSHRFIKNSSLYSRPVKRPSIYSQRTHAHLLCDANIAPCCRPFVRGSKRLKEMLCT